MNYFGLFVWFFFSQLNYNNVGTLQHNVYIWGIIYSYLYCKCPKLIQTAPVSSTYEDTIWYWRNYQSMNWSAAQQSIT